METPYDYFNRDISWLSFNFRVLMEADDDRLPLLDRIRFIAIYSSNLEEFYEVRVADHMAIVTHQKHTAERVQAAADLVKEINQVVHQQLLEQSRILQEKIYPLMKKQGLFLYPTHQVLPFHAAFVHKFFWEEVFPFLQPVLIDHTRVMSFLRNNRIYLAVRLYQTAESGERVYDYYVIKLPYDKVPRFIELPAHEGMNYLMFLEDLIKANLNELFPSYTYDSCYTVKLTRDADIFYEDLNSNSSIVDEIRKKVKKRKLGDVSQFVFDKRIPTDFLQYLCDTFRLPAGVMTPRMEHLSLKDFSKLPNVANRLPKQEPRLPMRLKGLNDRQSITNYIAHKDLSLHFPYHSFEHLIHLLYEAIHDPFTSEIKMTQYRVAENSVVINTLIAAAQQGKKVTVFVELKARFDEENNLITSELMRGSGINIQYSIPGLKVHAKVALIVRRDTLGKQMKSYAYVGTGNFNEDTAKLYSDVGLLTSNKGIVNDLQELFLHLERKNKNPTFSTLLVAQFNLLDNLHLLIHHEMMLAQSGKKGRILLKLNSLQDPSMIDELYRASQAGVEIDLIVRGICCLRPNQSYSKNIRITRIVDHFLEHARVYYFGNDGAPKIYIGSADWMKRNLYRRIEVVTPILDIDVQQEIVQLLQIQLQDNQKACWVDEHLNNKYKTANRNKPVRAQEAIYAYLKAKNDSGFYQ